MTATKMVTENDTFTMQAAEPAELEQIQGGVLTKDLGDRFSFGCENPTTNFTKITYTT